MAELKTKKTNASVTEFLNQIADDKKRSDALALLKLMKQVTGKKPKLWGASIVGFGDYHYRYASGHEGDSFVLGFSPRKQNLTLYFMGGLEQHKQLLKKLGKHTTGVACLYVKKLEDVNLDVLRDLMQMSFTSLKAE